MSNIAAIQAAYRELKTQREDWVQAFAEGENGPFLSEELARLQMIIEAFESVLTEAAQAG
ncbi:hypothetical protein [Rhizobium sp. AN5]|uniref:hypothetical protein n=1 Tax=Rhizobium sp. AN5 TaxID=1855304 RepID=UPI000BE26AA3|nr:hypothetical protein [Rhizobium sp. AN5]